MQQLLPKGYIIFEFAAGPHHASEPDQSSADLWACNHQSASHQWNMTSASPISPKHALSTLLQEGAAAEVLVELAFLKSYESMGKAQVNRGWGMDKYIAV